MGEEEEEEGGGKGAREGGGDGTFQVNQFLNPDQICTAIAACP